MRHLALFVSAVIALSGLLALSQRVSATEFPAELEEALKTSK